LLALQILALLAGHLAGLAALHRQQVLVVVAALVGTLALVGLEEAVALQQMAQTVLAAAVVAGHMVAQPTRQVLAVGLGFLESDQTELVA
jgi:hypothetical protein